MRLSVQGKAFHLDGEPHFLRTVSYGPFSPERETSYQQDFKQISQAGFDSLRVYHLPSTIFLDAAAKAGLIVIAGHAWAHGCDFFAEPELFQDGKQDLISWLQKCGSHPALGALLIGNEIPSDMARWMGPLKVVASLDQLIEACRAIAPDLLLGYANFPTTEYLEPNSADFTAFNVYLEDEAALQRYLPRLHHLAGDRPVYLTEFGLDTFRHSEEHQADLLTAACQIARTSGLSGATIYAWSDDWFNNGRQMKDWAFGLIRRDGTAKPALKRLQNLDLSLPLPKSPPRFSVIICTRNGHQRLPECIAACQSLNYPDYEIIVVNDGSTDGTEAYLSQQENIRTFSIPPCGLSAARNFGAEKATGEIFAYTDDDCQPDQNWLAWLACAYQDSSHAAIGGPNLSPVPDTLANALTTVAPGAPTHVMLTDTEAEHLPGCHLSVRRAAFEVIGGFDARFHTAGDDVDFCWRLRDAGFTLGFAAASFVWHDRRATVWKYLKQQMGYGAAEAQLFQKHPHRFSEGGVRWEGCVYQGHARSLQSGDVIYSGPFGESSYQKIDPTSSPPHRRLAPGYDRAWTRFLLHLITGLRSYLRSWKRRQQGGPGRTHYLRPRLSSTLPRRRTLTLIHPDGSGRSDLYRELRENGWSSSPETGWDLQKNEIHFFAATEQTDISFRRTFLALSGHSQMAEVLALAEAIGFTEAPVKDANS